MTSRKGQLHLFTREQILQTSPLPLPLIQLKQMNMQIKNTWKQRSNLPSSKNVTIIVVPLISLPSPSSDLLSSCWSQWKKMEFPVVCRHLEVLERRHVSPSTVFLLSFLLMRRRTHSEDTRKQKLQLQLCVLPALPLLLPHAARQTKRKIGHQAHPLQGKCRQAHENLRAMSSLSKPRNQQNLFSFHWKYRNRMGLSFP